MKSFFSSTISFLLAFGGLVLLSSSLHAADRVKANNTNALNQPASWVDGVVPTSLDIAVWDETLTLNRNASIGGNQTWAGIRVTTAGGNSTLHQITATSGQTLTLGASGIDMSLAELNFTIACLFNIGSTQTWDVAANRTLTLSGVVSGASGNTLSKNGTGTAVLSNTANTFTGPVVINGGVLQVALLANGGSNSSLGASSNEASNLTINGGTLRVTSTSTSDRGITIGEAGGTIESNARLQLTNTDALVLSGTNVARTLTLGGTYVGTPTTRSRLNAQITDNGTGATSLVKTGAGFWLLGNNANDYTGKTSVQQGGLVVTGNTGIDALGAPTTIANKTIDLGTVSTAGTLEFNNLTANLTTDRPINLVGNGTIAFTGTSANAPLLFTTGNISSSTTGNKTLTINESSSNSVTRVVTADISDGVLGSVLSLTKNGTRTVRLTGNNNYSGFTYVASGILEIDSVNRLGNGTIVRLGTGSTYGYLHNLNGVSSPLTLNRDLEMYGNGGLRNGWIVNGNVTVIGNETYVLELGIAGTGSGGIGNQLNGILSDGTGGGTLGLLMRQGNQTNPSTTVWTLTGNNTFSGNITVNRGTLVVTSMEALGAASGGAITLAGGPSTSGSVVLRHTGSSNGSTNREINFASTNSTYTATIENNGAGVITFNGNVTSSTSSAKTLILSGNNTGANTMAGVISETSPTFPTSLTKAGSGTWVLAGNNTYTGSTTVNAGTLLIHGDMSAATGNVTVATGATLGGNGTIGGNVFVSGTLSPGNSPGTLTLNSTNLTMNGPSSAISMEIIGTGPGQYDRVVGINQFSQNGALTISLTGIYTVATWNLFDFSSKLGNFSQVNLTGSYSGGLTLAGETWSGTVGGQNWTFDQTNGILTVIPEPGTFTLFGIGATFMLWNLRRRRFIGSQG
jgi:fibronectin-binding autotransporter adhesin